MRGDEGPRGKVEVEIARVFTLDRWSGVAAAAAALFHSIFIHFPDGRRDETGRRNARTDEFCSIDVGGDAIALGTRGGGVGTGGGCAAKRRRGARAVAERALDD